MMLTKAYVQMPSQVISLLLTQTRHTLRGPSMENPRRLRSLALLSLLFLLHSKPDLMHNINDFNLRLFGNDTEVITVLWSKQRKLKVKAESPHLLYRCKCDYHTEQNNDSDASPRGALPLLSGSCCSCSQSWGNRINTECKTAETEKDWSKNDLKKKRLARNTYPQLRHRLEQVKYSSGKKQLCATSSPAISPLKRSLSACREIKDQQILIHKLL